MLPISVRRKGPGRLPLLLGLAACASLLSARLKAAPPAAEAPRVAVPAGISVQVDGSLAPAEWADAAAAALAATDAVTETVTAGGTLRWKQARGTLLLAFESDRAWTRGAHLMVVLAPDQPEANALSPGAVTLDYEPLEHSRPHLLVTRAGEAGTQPVAGEVLVRASVHGPRPAVELALKPGLLGLKGKGPASRRVLVSLTRAVAEATATWPAGLDVGANPGQPPADLLSSTRWARLTGLVDADGPGALPSSTWEALLAEDQALSDKGHLAHARAFEILEEGGRKLEKQDRDVQRDVLDGFAWIAEREPLHPYDVLVRGQVLRHLNRHEEALAAFEALAAVREGDYAVSAAYERARTLEGRERFEEAAAAWRELAGRAEASLRTRYASAAERALAQVPVRDAEQAARAADEADGTLPLVLFRTSRGSFVALLHAQDLPQQVAHFLKLVEQPATDGFFYDGTLFHRVIGDALAQGGDPRTRSEGCDADLSGPASATLRMEPAPRHTFARGALGFARGATLENASAFFITTSPRHDFDGTYTCFGHVLSGLEVVERLERCDVLLSVRRLERRAPR